MQWNRQTFSLWHTESKMSFTSGLCGQPAWWESGQPTTVLRDLKTHSKLPNGSHFPKSTRKSSIHGALFPSLAAIQSTVSLLRAGSPPPHKEARQKRKELRQKLLAEQEELERQMKELQAANENKQKELETVRKVGLGADKIPALKPIPVVGFGSLEWNWASLSCSGTLSKLLQRSCASIRPLYWAGACQAGGEEPGWCLGTGETNISSCFWVFCFPFLSGTSVQPGAFHEDFLL